MKKIFLAFLLCASCESSKPAVDNVVDATTVNDVEKSESSVPEVQFTETLSDVTFCAADSFDSSVEDTVKDAVKADVK